MITAPPPLRIPVTPPQQAHRKSSSIHLPLTPGISSLVVTLVKRPSRQHAWGLSMSKFDQDKIILGSSTTVPCLVQGCWSAPTESVAGLNVLTWDDDFARSIPRRIIARAQPVHYTPAFLPGDLIIAVNGQSPCSITTSSPSSSQTACLQDLTTFLRSQDELCFVLFRHNGATQRACRYHELMLRTGQLNLNQASYAAACAAHVVIGALFTRTTPAQKEQRRERVTSFAGPPRVIHTGPMTTKPKPASKSSSPPKLKASPPAVVFRNPLFQDEHGRALPYCDNQYEYDADDGKTASLFLNPHCETNFPEWLQQRKRKWRSTYSVHSDDLSSKDPSYVIHDNNNTDYDDESSVSERHSTDFWTAQGFESWQDWLQASTAKWKQSYRWNRQKKQRIANDIHEVVQFNGNNFKEWLRVRKNQWLVLRRKRQRERVEARAQSEDSDGHRITSSTLSTPTKSMPPELIVIDALLEEKERESHKRREIPPLNLEQMLDPEIGCPDDTLVHCLSFINPLEYPKLLGINRKTRSDLLQRNVLWQRLCPTHWKLPRRPRKPWSELYFDLLRRDWMASRKQWDDLLTRAASLLFKGDQVGSIEKLVTSAQCKFQFDVNYTSAVVCERNSLLNLAVIHQRHKVVRWLVDVQEADLETTDRGQMTPLMNAAYAGDRTLVRYLLQRGADRSKVGLFHYTKALQLSSAGRTAEGWAAHRGFPEISSLIKLGL